MKDTVKTDENTNEVVNKRQAKEEVCSGKTQREERTFMVESGRRLQRVSLDGRQAALRGKDHKKGTTQEMKRRFPSEEHQSIID